MKLSNVSNDCESIHEYEVLDKYGQPQNVILTGEQQVGGFELTQCPAYNSVIHGNQQSESNYSTILS